jgi:hypothetical protein
MTYGGSLRNPFYLNSNLDMFRVLFKFFLLKTMKKYSLLFFLLLLLLSVLVTSFILLDRWCERAVFIVVGYVIFLLILSTIITYNVSHPLIKARFILLINNILIIFVGASMVFIVRSDISSYFC